MVLSRRDFLKLSGLLVGVAAWPKVALGQDLLRPLMLGRTIYLNNIYDQPSLQAKHIGVIPAQSVFGIYKTVLSADNHYNKVWYLSAQGYVHSASVQPVQWEIQQPT